ncbi:hypothetical protein AC630_08020 [Bradyrhizobium sp. AS23.2]|nr:hypothetical protein AC630_08020 [Bradyrhizobium sp. AS23.2]
MADIGIWVATCPTWVERLRGFGGEISRTRLLEIGAKQGRLFRGNRFSKAPALELVLAPGTIFDQEYAAAANVRIVLALSNVALNQNPTERVAQLRPVVNCECRDSIAKGVDRISIE